MTMKVSLPKKIGTLAFILICFYLFRSDEVSSFNRLRSLRSLVANEDGKSTRSLLPGELFVEPWWPVPSSAMRSLLYKTTSKASTDGRVNDKWSVAVKCEECVADKPFFYMRAYGPAVVSGTVRAKEEDGSYELSFVPLDPGVYTVEAVMTYSDVPDLHAFPLPLGVKEPYFEGRMLPGFPHLVNVAAPPPSVGGSAAATPTKKDDKTTLRRCTIQDLVNSSQARWKVVERTDRVPFPPFRDYVEPRSMTGVHMAYEYTNCHLPTLEELKVQLINLVKQRRNSGQNEKMLVLFVGDSVMALQYRNFQAFIEGIDGIKTLSLSTAGGLAAVMDSALVPGLRLVQYLQRENKETFVLYNAGLHDILNLCTQEKREERKAYIDYSKWPSEERPFSCTEEYHSLMQQLRMHMESIPAELHVFQTTNSGWNLHGMMGENGQQDHKLHPFPLSPHMVSHFNDIVVNDVLMKGSTNQTSAPPHVMDGFAMTAARPDNGQVTANNHIGGKMVHPGIEVVDAMSQVWIAMILDRLEAQEEEVRAASSQPPVVA